MALPILPIPAAPEMSGVWRYWRPTGGGAVELGLVMGHEVALPPHFHDEDQITFVLRGRRHFIVGGRRIDVPAGRGVHIPAGTPHRSLSGPSDVVGLNIYAPAGGIAAAGLIGALSRRLRGADGVDLTELDAIIESFRCSAAASAPPFRLDERETVQQAARRAGMSREGFSRRFNRLHGMAPQAFDLTRRLNLARHLLRAGESIAAVAVDAGFADQSHLGRSFRRSFGITPGRYRLG